MPVAFRLLGTPAAFDGERWRELGHTLDDAVLCYLALAGVWLPRAVLAGRFWPDSDEAAARANLRWRLHRLRSLPFTGELETTRDHVRWAVETDVARFWRAHQAGDWDDAVDIVQAPLLGVPTRKAPASSMPDTKCWHALAHPSLVRTATWPG